MTVLIVEDESPLAEVLRYNFEAEGFHVTHAATGEQAETLVLQERPDLVVLDWMLPELSGVEVCKRLRSRLETKSIPIVMLTGRGEEGDRIRGLASGVDDYVLKPFSIPELIARVRRSSAASRQTASARF